MVRPQKLIFSLVYTIKTLTPNCDVHLEWTESNTIAFCLIMNKLLLFIILTLTVARIKSDNCHIHSGNFPQSHNKIVGGFNAKLGQFPWQAALKKIHTGG